jgi:choline kinase
MADGEGKRWGNFGGVPKHLIEVDGETLLFRTVRLLKENGADDIIITSHDPRYEIFGTTRYEPKSNELEIDRFTAELIDDEVCFFLGDIYYTKKAIKTIFENENDDVLFFGNKKEIFAIKVKDSKMLKYHLDRVKQCYYSGKIKRCIGWELYKSINDIPFNKPINLENRFIIINDKTDDFDYPKDLIEWKKKWGK